MSIQPIFKIYFKVKSMHSYAQHTYVLNGVVVLSYQLFADV